MPEIGGVFGRGRELGAVAAFLDGLRSGPSGLLLEGEAGIGKTTVWSVGVAEAAARSYLVLSNRPAEAEAKLSFAALADLLEGVLEGVLAGLPAPQQNALQVALLLKDPAGRPPEHRAVCAAFLGVIRCLAAQGPVVIAVDDLQWLDHPSAVTLDYAFRRLVAEPVGLLASVRAGVGRSAAPPAGAGPPGGHLERLRIGPLAPADFEAAIRAGTGSRLSRLAIRRLFDACGGNLLYGFELARALGRMVTEPLPDEPLPVPADLQGVLGARIAALPGDVQDVLLAASCLRAPTATVLERANGPLAWPAVQSAVAEGVVEVEGSGIRFTHPLFASAIYSGAAPWRRREAHHRLSLIAATAEEQARHQALAAEGPDEEAAGALARAAHAAAARGAPGAAAELAELAVARTPAGLAPASRSRRLAAAEYLYRAGDTARARHGLEAVAQDMPSGPERAAARLVLARILLHDEGELVALPVLEDALAEASPDRILQARIRISLARTMGGDLRYCARHADAGLALARQAGDQALVRQARAEKLYNDFMLGGDLTLEPDGMVSECEPERGPAAVEERPVTILGLCLVRADRFVEARRLLERALQAAQEEGEESSQPILLAYLADLECWAGNWQAAECYAAQAWDVGEQVDHRAWRSVTCYARALIDAHLGRIDAARAEAADGLSAAAAAAGDDWAVLMLHAALGFAELSAGNVDAAETSLSHAAGLANRIGLAEPAAWRFHANHVEALVGLGDLDRAGELLGWLEVRGRATGRRWTLATAARCRGLLLAARGDTPGALQVLDEALRHHQHLAMPFELGRTLLVTGQLQRRAKRKALARQHLERALGIFESLPAPMWAARARTELSRIGLRPPAPLELTATEERVATLAASGHTNRQVAAELFLSPRTVEDNLARAYRKLGISSRAELGAAMTRRESAKPLPELSGAESMPVPRPPARCSSPAVGSPVRGNTGFVAGGRAPTVSVTGSPPGPRRIRKGQTDVPHREHRKGQAGQAEDEDSCVHDIVVRAFRRRDAFHRLRHPYMKAAAKGASSELRARMSWEYGTLATEVYEFDKPVGRPFADVEYYTGLLADVSGPILEPATGTGRILIPLLEAGHQVDGLDSSPQMLACCRQHCRDRGLDPVLREADMTVFVQLAAYEAVIIPAGSIALLDGRKATLQALTCFRDSLVPGGRLVVDVPVPRLAAGHEAMRYWRRGSCLWTLQTMHLEYDPAANQTTRFLRYDKWQDGTLRMTELQTFRLQHWNCREFEDLLAETGFTHVLVAADYENAATPRAADSVWTFHATVPQARSDGGQHLRSGQTAAAVSAQTLTRCGPGPTRSETAARCSHCARSAMTPAGTGSRFWPAPGPGQAETGAQRAS